MSPGKDEVPGPMVEEAEGPVEEVDPAPEDQQEIQSTVALEARNIIFNCFCVGLKRGKDSFSDINIIRSVVIPPFSQRGAPLSWFFP